MLVDARKIAAKETLEGDICIIGGGAAGLSMARTFKDSPHRVILLESGGLEFSEKNQALYAGKTEGVATDYLTVTRLRYLGGTTNHWVGYCSVYDEEELLPVRGMEHTGWPIRSSELDEYYKKTATLFNIPFRNMRAETFEPETERRFSSPQMRLRVWQIKPLRFREAFQSMLEESKNIRVLLNANAVNIQSNKDGGSITHVDARTFGGPVFRVKCTYYVLACGGIENPRMLLLSNSVHTNGLGNQHDLVGRYFMDHMQFKVGLGLLDKEIIKYPALYSQHTQQNDVLRYGFTFRHAVREREEIRNHNFRLERIIAKTQANNAPTQWLDFNRSPAGGRYVLTQLVANVEQTPNPESRITLNQERDALGLNRTTLRWQFLPGDKENFFRAFRLLVSEWGATKRARIRLSQDWLDAPWPYGNAWFGRHASGTTRMDNDPKKGVVDVNSKVHGIANLFVAGSSVFPNQSWQTPTFTISALSIRLAEHLDGLLATRA